MFPLEALRRKPEASFNKSFRKANEMLQVSLEELITAEGTTGLIGKRLDLGLQATRVELLIVSVSAAGSAELSWS